MAGREREGRSEMKRRENEARDPGGNGKDGEEA